MSKKIFVSISKLFTIFALLSIMSWSHHTVLYAQGYNEPLQHEKFSDVLDKSRSNTVRIVLDNDKKGFYAGSGWVVKPGYVLTNAHVVKRSDFDVEKISIELYSATSKYNTRVEAKLQVVDDVNDIALLTYSVNIRTKRLTGFDLATEDPVVGAKMLSIGSPVIEVPTEGQKIAHYGQDVLDFAYTEGVYTGKRLSLWLVPVRTILESDAISMFTSKGNSGGPIVNTEGDIVGMVRGFASYETPRTSLGVPLEALKGFIADHVPNTSVAISSSIKK